MDPAAKAEFTAELFETYHGVKIDVEYSVKSEIKVSTNLSKQNCLANKFYRRHYRKRLLHFSRRAFLRF